ncbi:MAG TPA: cell wall anchor protein [Pararhizobium sp.]|uniref:cell wall anchor protein n=1 Tax=Pararhizobium sp. TaxID=1977563 RepID=UPI002B85F805|nr:cell wall anchor protein [Pararhizobium sp.]HTO32077.1 cell wall anchor protein [Pararhizobium sp.]
MRSLLIMAAACLALSACTTTSIDAAIQKNLPQICSAAGTAHSAFVVVAAAGSIKPKTAAKEAAAWAALESVCTAPETATAASVLVRAAEAYAAITVALREAKSAS